MTLQDIDARIGFAHHVLATIADNHRRIYAREHNGQMAEELTDSEIIMIWNNNRSFDDPDAESMLDMRDAILNKP